MPRFARAALVALIFLAPAFSGCLESGTGGGAPDAPLEVTISPEDTTLSPPEQASWTVTLTVREETTIRHRGCPPALVDVAVEHPGGGRFPLYEYGNDTAQFGACAIRNVTLEPGTMTWRVDWNGRPQDARPAPHEGPVVAPLTYTVRATLAAMDRNVTATATVTVE